jgi:hypothetical protein
MNLRGMDRGSRARARLLASDHTQTKSRSTVVRAVPGAARGDEPAIRSHLGLRCTRTVALTSVALFIMSALLVLWSASAKAADPLPDGRVYEQVTPTEKEGNNPQGGFSTVQAAADGEAISYFGAGGFPGSLGAQDLPTFVARRSPTGWSSAGLLPPASTGPRARVKGWDENLSASFSSNFVPIDYPLHTLYERSREGAFSTAAELDAEAYFVGATPNGGIFAFETESSLEGEGAPFGPNVFVRDATTGQTSLASVFNNGETPIEGAYGGPYNYWTSFEGGSAATFYTGEEHVLSRSGRDLIFTDASTRQIYVRLNPTEAQSPLGPAEECTNPALACTLEVSASQSVVPDPNGPQPAKLVGATPDGNSIFFISRGALTEDATTGATDEGADLYRYDVQTGVLTDIASDTEDPNGAEVLGVIGFSEDASHIYFVANSVLGQTATEGAAPGTCTRVGANEEAAFVEGSCNLYSWNEGTLAYVDQLTSADGERGSASRNWAPGGFLSADPNSTGRVSANGEGIVFAQFEVVPPSGSEIFGRIDTKLFHYSALTGEVNCVSCSPSAPAAATNASLSGVHPFFIGPLEKSQTMTRNLSADGSMVFFDSPDALSPEDQNGVSDVYEWEASGSGTCQSTAQNGGCLYLLSTGKDPEPSYFADADQSGNNAFLFTSQRLVAQDKDQLVDIYDARVGGGIESQNSGEPSPCAGEGECRSASAAPPQASAPSTVNPPSEGNFVPQHHKKKNHKKKHHKKKHQQHTKQRTSKKSRNDHVKKGGAR